MGGVCPAKEKDIATETRSPNPQRPTNLTVQPSAKYTETLNGSKSNQDRSSKATEKTEEQTYHDTPILVANMNDEALVKKGKKVVYVDHLGIKNPNNGQTLGLRPIIIIKLPNKNSENENEKFSYHAMDEFCYHMGGELSTGDIEDIDGKSCVICPLHNYIFDIKTGEEIMQDPQAAAKPNCHKFINKGTKQRCHKVDCNYENGEIHVTLNFKDFGELPSDSYAASMSRPVPKKKKPKKIEIKTETENTQAPSTTNDGNNEFALPCDFEKFTIIDKQQHNHNTYLFKFGLKASEMRLGLPIGKHIRLKYTDSENDNKEIIRSYTPISQDSQTKGYFELLIKVYEQGKMTQYLSKLNINDSVLMAGPHGRITYQSPGILKIDNCENIENIKHIGMIAGGTGITPMYQVIQTILSNSQSDTDNDPTKISLIFANNSIDDILLKSELESLAAKHENQFKLYFTVTDASASSDWQGGVGYISENMAQEHLPAPTEDSIVMLCGPPPMIEAIKPLLTDRIGHDSSRVIEF